MHATKSTDFMSEVKSFNWVYLIADFNKLNFIKTKTFVAPKTLREQKDKLQTGRKCLQIIYAAKVSYPEYHTFKYVKRCPTSLGFREMQIKTTMRYCCTPIKMIFLKTIPNT